MEEFKSQLLALTKEQKIKAFEKAKEEANFTEGRLVLVTEEYYPTALKFVEENFIRQEPIEKALGQPWNDEVKEFYMDFLTSNLAIMLLDNVEDVIAIRFATIGLADQHVDDDSIKTPQHKMLMQFYHMGERKADFFGRFGTKECIQFFGLGTNDKYRHLHVATRLFECAVNMMRYLGVDPIYIKGEGSNQYSQKVYEHEGFELLHEEPYADWEVNGERPLANTGDHHSLRYYGLKASAKK